MERRAGSGSTAVPRRTARYLPTRAQTLCERSAPGRRQVSDGKRIIRYLEPADEQEVKGCWAWQVGRTRGHDCFNLRAPFGLGGC
jgi:hypothetical protein